MGAIAPRSDSGKVSRTSLNLARPSDVRDEFDFDVTDPQLWYLITTARAPVRSGISLQDVTTYEQFLDDNSHLGYSTTRVQEWIDILAITLLL